MRKVSPTWRQKYDAAADDDGRAAYILAAADAAHRRGEHGQADIARAICGWIQEVRNQHPLCMKQSAGAPIMALGYRNEPFSIGPWRPVELAALANRSGDSQRSIRAAVPSRSVRASRMQIEEQRSATDTRRQQNVHQRHQPWERQDSTTRCPVPVRLAVGQPGSLAMPVPALFGHAQFQELVLPHLWRSERRRWRSSDSDDSSSGRLRQYGHGRHGHPLPSLPLPLRPLAPWFFSFCPGELAYS